MVTTVPTSVAGIAGAEVAGQLRPGLAAIWRALEEVPDPEIPVVSVLDLGIVRAIAWDASEPSLLVVRVTPTYSGCPATELIIAALREALLVIGVPAVRIETVLSPAWTTAWLTPEGERKLRAYGIAPPGAAVPLPAAGGQQAAIDVAGISPLRSAIMAVACPRCGSNRTQLVAQFGSTACKAQYRCNDCLEPFDFFKSLA